MDEIHFVTGPEQSLEELVRLCRAVTPWLDRIHLRKRGFSPEQLQDWGHTLIDAAGVDPQRLVVNGNAEVAKSLGCRGVHLPEGLPVESIPGGGQLRLGCSVHSLPAAVEKEQKGADYLFFGHVFASGSKPGQKPRGLKQLRQVTTAVKIPVIAIGGVTVDRIPLLAKAGCSGVAVISAIADAPDPGEAARRLKEALRLGREVMENG